MTEEIIIDGVNVAGCGAYKDKHCKDKTSIMFCDINLCSNYPYCYYKQLKRLEQENKELRQQYNCYACDTCQGKEDYRNMKRHCENAIKTVHTYRSALGEIREIVNEPCIEDEDCETCDSNCMCKEILDKINEVLG